jgi:hypothetical protein
MGIVFGRTGSAEPAFDLIRSTSSYEVRNYGNLFTAVTHIDTAKKDGKMSNNAFSTLAKYIGVFGTPENKLQQPIAMTAPVLMDEDQCGNTENMAFVLPFEFRSMDEIPSPTDKRVEIKEIPGETVAVAKFSGWYTASAGRAHLKKMCEQLRLDGLCEDDELTVKWRVAQYHPPFTIPFLRRNEIWVTLDTRKVNRAIEQMEKEGD